MSMSSTLTKLPDRGATAQLTATGRRTLAYFSAATVAMLLASVIYAPYASTGPVMCPFRIMTGLPCPGCGLTRSFCHISSGHLMAAFADHLFGPIVYLGIVISLPVMIYQLITNRRIDWFHRLVYSRQLAKVMAVSLISYHFLRILQMVYLGQVLASVTHSPLINLLRHL
jgi:hypothetical protein